MLIVVGEPFSSQWDKNAPHEPGQCRVCQQKDATRWTTDHVYIMGRKRLPGMTGELCTHCSHFKASEQSQKTIDQENLRQVSILHRQMLRNTENIQARWQARKLRQAIQDQKISETRTRKM